MANENRGLEIPQELRDVIPEINNYSLQLRLLFMSAYAAGQQEALGAISRGAAEFALKQDKLKAANKPAGSVLSAGSMLAQRSAIEPAELVDPPEVKK